MQERNFPNLEIVERSTLCFALNPRLDHRDRIGLPPIAGVNGALGEGGYEASPRRLFQVQTPPSTWFLLRFGRS